MLRECLQNPNDAQVAGNSWLIREENLVEETNQAAGVTGVAQDMLARLDDMTGSPLHIVATLDI